MDIKQQFVTALFDKGVRLKAAQMFQPGFDHNGFNDRYPLELFDITFRLHKPTPAYVNLEFLVSSPNGRYFQPVGFFQNDSSVWVLNQFTEVYKQLFAAGQITEGAKFADKKTNAVIAAFSMQTVGYAVDALNEFRQHGWEPDFRDGMMIPPQMRYDKRFENNGFNCELLFSNEGYPQFYLDDEHELEGAIGAYIRGNDGRISIHPAVEYKNLFDTLSKFKLLTAFNKI